MRLRLEMKSQAAVRFFWSAASKPQLSWTIKRSLSDATYSWSILALPRVVSETFCIKSLTFDMVLIRDKVATTPATPNTLFINEDFPTPDYDNGKLVFRLDYPWHQHLSNDQDAEPEGVDEMTSTSESVQTYREQDATVSLTVEGSCQACSERISKTDQRTNRVYIDDHFNFPIDLAVH